jgi:hypothetical protein
MSANTKFCIQCKYVSQLGVAANTAGRRNGQKNLLWPSTLFTSSSLFLNTNSIHLTACRCGRNASLPATRDPARIPFVTGADGTLHFQLREIPLEYRLQLVSILNGYILKTRYNQTFNRTPLRLRPFTHCPATFIPKT